jgi:hypothetical protein
MTQWGLDVLFNPAKRHMDEEKRRLQSTREEIGDSSGGKRIDFESGKVTIERANEDGDAALEGADESADASADGNQAVATEAAENKAADEPADSAAARARARRRELRQKGA